MDGYHNSHARGAHRNIFYVLSGVVAVAIAYLVALLRGSIHAGNIETSDGRSGRPALAWACCRFWEHISRKPALIPCRRFLPPCLLLFWCTTFLLLNEFPDVEADKTGGRKTLPITMGKTKRRRFLWRLTILVYLWIIGSVIVR